MARVTRRSARRWPWFVLLAFQPFLQPANADTHTLSFVSDGVELPALLHVPETGAPISTVVYLHGNPGSPLTPESDLADALLAKGLAVFRFNYRGLWGNDGDFSLANSIVDFRNAMAFLLAEGTLEEHGIESDRIVLVGYSFGTSVALTGGHGDARVDGIVALTPCDHGYFGAEFPKPDSVIREFLDTVTEQIFGEGGPVEDGAELFIDDLVTHSQQYRFEPLAPALLDTPLLFLVALDDAVCPPETHFFPLYRALAEAGHERVTADVMNMDHGFAPIGREVVWQRVADWVVVRPDTE